MYFVLGHAALVVLSVVCFGSPQARYRLYVGLWQFMGLVVMAIVWAIAQSKPETVPALFFGATATAFLIWGSGKPNFLTLTDRTKQRAFHVKNMVQLMTGKYHA